MSRPLVFIFTALAIGFVVTFAALLAGCAHERRAMPQDDPRVMNAAAQYGCDRFYPCKDRRP